MNQETEKQHGGSVLIVDDCEADVDLVSVAMRRIGWNAHLAHASNGLQGLEVLDNMRNANPARLPDLIFLDLNLPHMDGRDMLRALKSDARFQHIPVVIFSTSERQSDIDEAYASHANSYVTKPMGFSGLEQTLKTIQQYWLQVSRLPSSSLVELHSAPWQP